VTRTDRTLHLCYLLLSCLFGVALARFVVETLNGDAWGAFVFGSLSLCCGTVALVVRQVQEDRVFAIPVDTDMRVAVHAALQAVSRSTGHHPANRLLVDHVERTLLSYIHHRLRGPDGTTQAESTEPR
jgi:hypothetical protein